MKERHLDPSRLNLVRLCQDGHWVCRGCERVTEVNVDGPVNMCVLCGSSDLEWREPAFGAEAPGAVSVTYENETVFNGSALLASARRQEAVALETLAKARREQRRA